MLAQWATPVLQARQTVTKAQDMTCLHRPSQPVPCLAEEQALLLARTGADIPAKARTEGKHACTVEARDHRQFLGQLSFSDVPTYHLERAPILTSYMMDKMRPKPPPSCSSSIKSAIALLRTESTASFGISHKVSCSATSRAAATAKSTSPFVPPHRLTVDGFHTIPLLCIHASSPASLLLLDMASDASKLIQTIGVPHLLDTGTGCDGSKPDDAA